MTHQTTQAPAASGIVTCAPPPSVRPLTDEPTAEEATDADHPLDGRTPRPGPHPLAGTGRPDPDSQSAAPRGPAPSAGARDPRRGRGALVRPTVVRCARCGRRGRFVRLTTLARHRGQPHPHPAGHHRPRRGPPPPAAGANPTRRGRAAWTG